MSTHIHPQFLLIDQNLIRLSFAPSKVPPLVPHDVLISAFAMEIRLNLLPFQFGIGPLQAAPMGSTTGDVRIRGGNRDRWGTGTRLNLDQWITLNLGYLH